MKKVLVYLSVIVVFVCLLSVGIYYYQINRVGVICADEDVFLSMAIKHYEEGSPVEIKLGEIADKNDAKNKGIKALRDTFGERVDDYKPYRLYYDEKNDIWYMVGSVLPIPNLRARIPYIAFQNSDGKVVAMGR